MMVQMADNYLNVSVPGLADRFAVVKALHNSQQPHVFLNMPRYAAQPQLSACHVTLANLHLKAHTHTHTFNGPFSGTTRVSRYQKIETNLDFTEARDSEWQWHQLGHMQVCISLQTDNHASTPPL